MPEYTKGTGPNQLPQGGATAANAAVPSPEQAMQPQPADIPVDYTDPKPIDDGDPRDSENLSLLTGPADPAFKPRPQAGHVSKVIIRNLPLLAVARKNPSAPMALNALFKALLQAAENQHGEYD